MIRLKTAAALLDSLWPEFEERDEVVIMRGMATPQLHEFESKSEAESFYSHTHMVDLFNHRMKYIHDEEFDLEKPDPSDPEHELSWQLAQRIGQMWLRKLAHDFPRDRFRVYVTRYDDPTVRFHKVRDREAFWLEDTPVAGEKQDYVVYDSSHSSKAGRA